MLKKWLAIGAVVLVGLVIGILSLGKNAQLVFNRVEDRIETGAAPPKDEETTSESDPTAEQTMPAPPPPPTGVEPKAAPTLPAVAFPESAPHLPADPAGRVVVGSAARPPAILTRAGAQLAGAVREQGYYVLPEPVPNLSLVELNRAGGPSRLLFDVQTFAQEKPALEPGAFHLERGGDVLAIALARQLDAMKLQIRMDVAPLLEEGKRKIQMFAYSVAEPDLALWVEGTVRQFSVQHTRDGSAGKSTATLDAEVVFIDRGSDVAVYRASRRLESSATAPAGAADRARAAADAAVRSYLALYFADPACDAALADWLAKHPPATVDKKAE